MIQTTPDAVRLLAAEDVAVGDYVVVMNVCVQFPSFYWCSDTALASRNETVSLSYFPQDAGQPLQVVSVCVPFVLVEEYSGLRRVLDLRQCRIARVSDAFAEKTPKSLAKNQKR